jgi:hypothetical protein
MPRSDVTSINCTDDAVGAGTEFLTLECCCAAAVNVSSNSVAANMARDALMILNRLFLVENWKPMLVIGCYRQCGW